MSDLQNLPLIYGNATLAATGDATIIAAPGANRFIRAGAITITIHSALINAQVALEDGVGGRVLWELDAEAADAINGSHSIFLAGDRLTVNTLLNLTIRNANATAFVSAQGWEQSSPTRG